MISPTPRASGPGEATPGPQTPVLDPEAGTRHRLQPPYHVILHDDDDHTFEYVIEMLRAIFGFPPQKGFLHAMAVHSTGRSILITTTLEHAELKQEQIHAYGPDHRIRRCAGSMTATIEPAA